MYIKITYLFKNCRKMNVYYQSAAMSSHSKHVRVGIHRAVKEAGSNLILFSDISHKVSTFK